METRTKEAETNHTAISSQRGQIIFTNFSTTFRQQPHFTTPQNTSCPQVLRH